MKLIEQRGSQPYTEIFKCDEHGLMVFLDYAGVSWQLTNEESKIF